eukprot:COSAG06_NODE_4785_length_3955_cov_1.505446_2_plen_64_part_00
MSMLECGAAVIATVDTPGSTLSYVSKPDAVDPGSGISAIVGLPSYVYPAVRTPAIVMACVRCP